MLDIDSLIEETKSFAPANKEELETFRVRFLGKKGLLTELFAKMKEVAPEERKSFGLQVNSLKVAAEDRLNQFKDAFEDADTGSNQNIDLSLPSDPNPLGSLGVADVLEIWSGPTDLVLEPIHCLDLLDRG